jgi:hypothetical protein
MKRKRNLNTWFLIHLRKLGMLCKKPAPAPKRIRISRTVYPDGNITPIQAEQHIWAETKKAGRKNCQFDVITATCPCGVIGIEQFALSCNKTNK